MTQIINTNCNTDSCNTTCFYCDKPIKSNCLYCDAAICEDHEDDNGNCFNEVDRVSLHTNMSESEKDKYDQQCIDESQLDDAEEDRRLIMDGFVCLYHETFGG